MPFQFIFPYWTILVVISLSCLVVASELWWDMSIFWKVFCWPTKKTEGVESTKKWEYLLKWGWFKK